ncbi:MAG: OmpA family protein [Bacteroidota bacterium]
MLKQYSIIYFLALVSLPSFCQKVENLGSSVNSTYNEFSPVITPDGKTLYFLREGHPQNRSKEKYSCDVWSANLNNGIWSPASHLQNPFNLNVSNSIYSISPDGNTIITNWVEESTSLSLTKGFGIIKKTEKGWSKNEKLDIPKFEKMCKGRFQFGTLSADGKSFLMSFSQTKNGIEDDIYVSFLEKNGSWTVPMNLGDDINTNFTECIPFLAPDGYTIYFSSDREGGLGSNDIYMAKRLDRSWQKWSKPKNMGPSINSEDYDGYFTLSAIDDFAYFTTRKSSLGKSDIVRVKLSLLEENKESETDEKGPKVISAPIAGAIGGADDKNADKKSNADPVVLLSGKVLDGKNKTVPINAKVIYEDLTNGQELGVATPDPLTGEYKIVLPYGKNYGITPIADGYIGNSFGLDLTKNIPKKYLEIGGKDLTLIPAESGQKLTLNNIFFEFAKTNLQEESFPELNRLIDFLDHNKGMQIEISGHTDSIGSDEVNNRISQGRADAVKNYLINQGKIPSTRIVTKGYGKTRPVASNETEEGQQANRRVEFLILKN